jgi:N-acetylglucosamine PTS system EIICBA or EIICB component
VGILAYLQRIGRSLMVPVAVLPAAAILLGIGYWLDPNGWGTNNIIAAFMIKSGSAIIDHMAVLFAVGVAYGMSKDKDGSAALGGLVGFLVVTTLLSPSSVALLTHTDIEHISPAFGKIENQFVGILIGVISAELYNRFSGVELHKALAFFSGRRLVPIIISVVMLFLSFILLYVWPVVYNGLVIFGQSIKDMGAVGAGIYGFFNRLLIPVGLHHALNSVFWFDVAGINDIPYFLGGSKSIADGVATVGITGRYQAGFFPVMMFGLPGAALAIYQTAKKQNKEKTASIMIAAAFAAFFTGITEPLEFSFMFVAPVLYFIHAVLMAISMYIAASMQWIAGFGFSAGLVDLALSSRNPLAINWYMLILQGLVFFVLYYVVFRFFIVKLNLKTPGREDDENSTSEAPAIAVSESDLNTIAKQYIDIVGGKENLTNIDACITRLRLGVNDADLVDVEKAKALGAIAVIKLSKQGVQIVVGTQAEKIANAMKQHVNVN